MRNFCIISNDIKDRKLFLMQELAAYIESKGGHAICICAHEGSERRRLDFDASAISEDTECILVLGGDGTLIRVATRLEHCPIPIVGINLGNLGYLCELDRASAPLAIDRLMANACSMEDRMMLTGCLAGGTQAPSALNDIVIHQSEGMSLIRLQVSVNGEYLTTYDADGIILATPTGSTGYNMSAGGPIVEPKAQMILLTPINAHSLRSKSIVLDANDEIEITLCSRRPDVTEHAAVSFDGDIVLQLDAGDCFQVRRSENVTSICKLNKESFLEIMRKKMEN